MAKLVFQKTHDGNTYVANTEGGTYYCIEMMPKRTLHRLSFQTKSRVAHIIDGLIKTKLEIMRLAQFIEDNHSTLTLEQLDNIEEVYLRSKNNG
jgi:hypothetical protein